jgi:hypothetical protein
VYQYTSAWQAVTVTNNYSTELTTTIKGHRL